MIDREIREQLYDPEKYYGVHYPRYKIIPIEVSYIKGGKKVYYQVIDPLFKKRIGLDVVKSLIKEGRAHFIDEPTEGMGELYADLKPNTAKAYALGVKAFKKGLKRAPYYDKELMVMMKGREVGDPRTKPELKAWIKGWDKANVEAPYDPRKSQGGSWLDFVKAHKHMRTPRGLLNLRAISKLWKEQKAKRYDPKKHGLSRPPKNWFYAMLQGIRKGSDVRNPAAIVGGIWKRLSSSKKAEIKKREANGEQFKYDLPLPEDMPTRGTGTVRMVQPFKLAEVQVNLSVKDYLTALRSKLFSSMKRQDGTTALVARCKSPQKNVNVFIDKVKP